MAVSSSASDHSAVVTLVKDGSGEAAPRRRVGMRMMEMMQMLVRGEGGGEVGVLSVRVVSILYVIVYALWI